MSGKIAKVTWDAACKERYTNEDGRFRGAKGERFENCVRAVKNCASGVKNPDAFCAYLGRKSPRWSGHSSSALSPVDHDILLSERVAAAHFALSVGESHQAARFYAREVERVLLGCECGCGSEKQSVEEPALRQLSDFSQRLPGDDDLKRQQEVQYGEQGLAAPTQLQFPSSAPGAIDPVGPGPCPDDESEEDSEEVPVLVVEEILPNIDNMVEGPTEPTRPPEEGR